MKTRFTGAEVHGVQGKYIIRYDTHDVQRMVVTASRWRTRKLP